MRKEFICTSGIAATLSRNNAASILEKLGERLTRRFDCAAQLSHQTLVYTCSVSSSGVDVLTDVAPGIDDRKLRGPRLVTR